MVCIACPLGCRLTAEWDGDGETVRISGNKCLRGEEYGVEEVLSPRRVVTATVAAAEPASVRVPVKTNRPLPKGLIDSLLDDLYRLRIELPAKRGDAIVSDYRASGVDVVVTRSIAGDAGE